MADDRHVSTGLVRFSYAHLTEPFKSRAAKPEDEPKYSVTILLPKNDFATKQRIDAAIEAAKQMGAAEKWGGMPKQLALPIYDGDGQRPSDGEDYGDECKGCWVFTASCPKDQRPKVVDANLNPILDATEIYSGMYGRVSVDFFPYLNSGKKGIGAGLVNVQKLQDGEPLGRRVSVEDDFGTPVAAPATPAYSAPSAAMPPYGYTPPPSTAMPPYGYQPAQPAYGMPPQMPPMGQYPQQPPTGGYPPQIDPLTGQPMTAYGAQ